MMLDRACTKAARCDDQSLFRRYLTPVSGMCLMVVAGACGTGHKTEIVEVPSEPSAQGADAAQAPTDKPGDRAKKAGPLRQPPLQLVYRQAYEQARAHLTAENAHLRLDELDAQIEHEKEISR